MGKMWTHIYIHVAVGKVSFFGKKNAELFAGKENV